MKLGLFLIFILALTSCFKKHEVSPEVKPNSPVEKTTETSAALRENTLKKAEAPELLTKDQREAIYFSASLEKEALRVMTKNQYTDDMSLFSVLSYAVESAAGIKKSAPNRLDCTRFQFATNPVDKNQIQVSKICQKPNTEVATIKLTNQGHHLTITFLIKEWASVVGLSVAAVTGTDVVCDLEIKNRKLSQLNCLNWTKSLGSSATSSEELKLKTFTFNRDGASQFTVKGGLYKDLVERRKIEMRVPLEGKIKLIEKEIEVIDEFAEKPPEPKVQAIEIGAPPKTKKSDIEQLGELIEKNSKQNQSEAHSQEIQQQNGFEENQNGQNQIQNGTEAQTENGSQNQNQEGQSFNDQKGEPVPQEIQHNQNRSQGYQPQNGSEQPIPQGRQDETNGGIPPKGR